MYKSIIRGYVLGIIASWVLSVPCLAYEVIILHPDNTEWSRGNAIGNNVQAGCVYNSGVYAAVWHSGSPDPVYIGGFGSEVKGIYGSQCVGFIGKEAALWNESTAESHVSLHPNGYRNTCAYSIYQNQQVGSGQEVANGPSRALLWSGTAESVVNLHPSEYYSSAASDVYNGYQVGVGSQGTSDSLRALMWNSTAESVVSLHPSSGIYTRRTVANAIWGDYQGGWAMLSTAVHSHAVMWNGTAESIKDIHPSGFEDSEITDMCGKYQVGRGWTSDSFQALLWQGSVESVINLHSYLPSGYSGSNALGVDSYGNVVGYAYKSDVCHAVLWQVPEPCMTLLFLLGSVIIIRKQNRL